MSDHSRRTFLKAAGGAVGSAALLTGSASADGSGGPDRRFLVDLREVSRSEVPEDIEIIHDISEIDVLAARGDPGAVPGSASTVADLAVYQHDATPEGGPAKEHSGKGRGSKGPAWDSGEPTNTELQWDKRAQRVGDLTENPGNGRTVQDTATGEGTRVAVIDSGVYDGHPDLAGVVNEELSENFTTDPYDFRPNGAGNHGTHVAGIVAGTNADGEGILGTAPDTEILSHRVFSGVQGASGDTIAAVVDAASKGCDAANLSLGYPLPYVYPDEYPFLLDVKEMYERAVEYARSQDMVVVNSAGNDALDMDQEGVLSLPTEVENVFGVAATGPIGYLWDDKKPSREDKALKKLDKSTAYPANYTNYGEAVDVSAAGGNYDPEAIDEVEGWYYDLVLSSIYETNADGETVPGYGWKAGTSMAAPQVAGAVALVRSLRPDASAEEVENLIRETARDAPEGETFHGAGHLDLRRLVKRAR